MQPKSSSKQGYYTGQLLIATPNVVETCFERAVIYMCVHNEHGAMGVMINHPIKQVDGQELLRALMVDNIEPKEPMQVHLGGPVEPMKGFVLHTGDYMSKTTLQTESGLHLTSNRELFENIAAGKPPENWMLLLGYAGWTAGQLEEEMQQNSWITAPCDMSLVFHKQDDIKWIAACRSVGVDPYMLSESAGHC